MDQQETAVWEKCGCTGNMGKASDFVEMKLENVGTGCADCTI